MTWVRSRETHPGPHSAWFWDGRLTGGGAIIDLGCHCIEIIRNFVGKGNRPVEVLCHTDTLVHPIADEDNAVAFIRFESGAIGQFEVSWTFRGGMDLRDEVAGTHGTIWLNHFLRTGFEMFSAPAAGGGYVAEKAETSAGWLFPVGDEVSELGYVDMFSDMFRAIDEGRAPRETFYDGYVVNAIMDAALPLGGGARLGAGRARLAGRRRRRGSRRRRRRYEGQVVIKREILPDGRHKLILKDPASGDFTRPDRRGLATAMQPLRDATIPLRDGRTLAYCEWGDARGPAVFAFHGAPGSRVWWPGEAETLAAGARLVTVDRPGCGGSTHSSAGRSPAGPLMSPR